MDSINKKCTEEGVRYMTVKEIAEDPSFPFTEPALRWYIWNAETSGLSFAVYRVNRKVLIRRDLFVEWLERHSIGG